MPPGSAFSLADLFSLEVATDPQLSPDGSTLAYVRRSADIMTDRVRSSIWLVDTASGVERAFASGTGSYSSPRWSNDGSRLAYLASSDGSPAQIFVRAPAAPEPARITDLKSAATNIAWSPDGRFIAFTAFTASPSAGPASELPPQPPGASWAPPPRYSEGLLTRSDDDGYLRSGFMHLFVVPSEGGAARQLTVGNANESGPLGWTPDSAQILFSADRDPDWELRRNKSRVYSVGVHSAQVAALTPRGAWTGQPAASPDGKWIAFTSYADDRKDYHVAQLMVMDSRGGHARSLTPKLDRSIADFCWSADSRTLYASYDDRGRRKLARIGLDASRLELPLDLAGPLLDRPYAGGSFSVARDGLVAATTGSATRPADVSLLAGGALRQLTHLNPFLESRKLADVRVLHVRSRDGLVIDSWLTIPAGHPGRRLPLILEIHGGPRQAYGPSFSFDDQLYAAAGFAVLSVNPRGSSSYGEHFAGLIYRDIPGKDYDDLMLAVDEAVRLGYADGQRLFVTGGSGGGLLAAWIIGKTNQFRAAAVQRPIINMASFILTSDQPAYYADYWFGGFPWDDPLLYWKRSPLSLAGIVTTPTLLVVGDRDFRTPASEAEQFYSALKLRNVPAALLEVPAASHSSISSRPSQAAARIGAIIHWFRRFDQPAPADAPGLTRQERRSRPPSP